MKQVTENFKNNIKTYGRQFDFEIKVNDVDISNDDVNYIKPSFNSNLFKTIMHQIEIDSKNKISLKSKIKIKAGVKVNEPDYEYINYNTCIVNSSEKQEDTMSYKILAYDKMIESMIDYDLNILEKITLRDYLIRICERLGWNTDNIPNSFINSDKLVDPRLHIGIGYTFRDVLDEIATISCSFLLFKEDNFYLLYPIDTNQNIDNEYLDEDNVTIGEKYFINSLIFSRAEESDNIYRKNDTSIQLNGLHEYRISDNQLLSTNDRDLYIDDMFNYLKTFEFYIFDVSSKGILFLEACDRLNFVLSGNTYSTILLNNEIVFEDGLTELLYVEKPIETETEYKYADTTDKRINQTYILVDKQNQIIESVVSNVDDQNQKISEVTQTVNEINSKISDIADITTSKESTNAVLEFEGINQSEPIHINIHPIGTNIAYLYPRENLYPSDDLFMPVRTLRFTNITTNEIWDYEIPDDLLYYDGQNYDEFLFDYDSQTVMINKRCGWNADGTVYLLESMVTSSYEFPKIELTDGDYKVELLGYSNVYMLVRLMAQNIYTTQFATKAELNSEIKQTTEEIDLSVDKKLGNYSTTTQMNSAINIKANEITSTVSETYETKNNATTNYSKLNQSVNEVDIEVGKKYNTSDFTNAKITAKLNDGTSSVQISADKIDLSATDILNLLAGNTINLTSKNIVISSNNFNVDKNGNIKLKSNNGSTGGTTSFNIEGNNRYVTLKEYYNRVFIDNQTANLSASMGVGDASSGVSASIGLNGISGTDFVDMSIEDETGTALITVAGGGNYTYIKPNEVKTPKVTQTSLESIKKNIKKIDIKALELIKNSDIYTYNFKSEADTDKKHYGFIIADEGGNYKTPDEVLSDDKQGIDTYSMSSIMWKAFQEQQELIEQLQKNDKKKDKTIKQLQKEIKEMKEMKGASNEKD